jgi:glycosyltransferase involved in cell wall biosynthesis
MPTGNGAYIVHRTLARRIAGYRLCGYAPYWTLVPWVLRRLCPAAGAGLIHTTPDYAVFFQRPRLPLIVTFHNYVLDAGMRPYSSKLQRLHYLTDLRLWIRRAVAGADAITAVSRYTAALAAADLGITRPVRVITNAVDTDMFRPSNARGNDREEVRVFFSGNLTRRKGVQWLADIAERIDSNVCIYYTRGLRTRCGLPSHPRLKPLGPVPFEQMPKRYREMDIFLLPTVREGFSMAVLEAMACGLPVVASRCASLPEQIDHGSGGYLCGLGNVEQFAERINRLAGSPELRRTMGGYNRSRTETRFALPRMIAAYQELFETVWA